MFTSKAEFARWLERHNRSYEEWVKLHPSATWFHKEPPVLATRPAKPPNVKAAEVDREFARIFVAAAFGLLAVLLAGAVIRSGRGSLPGFRRARPGPTPLAGPAPAHALEDAARAKATPARAAMMALPNGTYPALATRRGSGNVVPIYLPPEPDAEPAVARPAASHEAPVLDFRPAFVAEPAPIADLEPVYETAIDPELLVVSEPAVVSWPEAARQAEPVFEAEPEQEERVDAEDPPAVSPPVVHPQPVVHPRPVVRAAPPPETKPIAQPPETKPAAPPAPVEEAPPVEAPAASATTFERPLAPAEKAVDEPTVDDHVAPAEEVAAEEVPLTCEIGIWQGYLKSQFYASAIGPDGQEYAVAESARFRSKNPLVRDEASAAAHAQLAEELLELGWKPEGSNGNGEWWALRFRLDDEIVVD